jgi:hypothetical protein
VLLIGSGQITGQPEVEPEGDQGRNRQDGKDGAEAGAKMTVGASPYFRRISTIRSAAWPSQSSGRSPFLLLPSNISRALVLIFSKS